MGMEKRGVVDGEGTPPNDYEKTAATQKSCGARKCCGQEACGQDTLSKMAEAASKDGEKRK